LDNSGGFPTWGRKRRRVMSCYFRHMKDVFEEAGIEVTKENKKEIDQIIHELVNVPYKQCSPAWKGVKTQIKMNDEDKGLFIKKLKKRFGSMAKS
jgi:hypothetical protein